MMQRITVYVQVPDRNNPGDFKELYSNSIDVDDSLTFDYQKVLKVLKLLYPLDGVMVSFSIM